MTIDAEEQQTTHPALAEGRSALVTGAASGIGRAIATRLASLGMKVVMVDLPNSGLDAARETVVGNASSSDVVVALEADVGEPDQIRALAERVRDTVGPLSALFANAGIQPGSSIFDEAGTWDKILTVNLMGIVRSAQTLIPSMIEAGGPGLVVLTGSKQGITAPPGDPAYNVAKAGVKLFAEALQHDLRNRSDCQVEARLFIPGFVFTPLTANGRTEKPNGAWTPEQTVAFLFEALSRDDFYILCPDSEVDRETDVRRIRWASEDITENRPPLSRWHPDFAEAFKRS